MVSRLKEGLKKAIASKPRCVISLVIHLLLNFDLEHVFMIIIFCGRRYQVESFKTGYSSSVLFVLYHPLTLEFTYYLIPFISRPD